MGFLVPRGSSAGFKRIALGLSSKDMERFQRDMRTSLSNQNLKLRSDAHISLYRFGRGVIFWPPIQDRWL